MTIPFERTQAVVQAKELLQDLLDPKKTPRVPRAIRGRAKAALRHFPTLLDIEQAHRSDPELFGPAPPFSRLSGSSQVLGILDAATQALPASTAQE